MNLNKNIKLLFLVPLLSPMISQSQIPPTDKSIYLEFGENLDSLTWNATQYPLPEYDKWKDMYDLTHEITEDLNNQTGQYRLVEKVKGGSSAQLLVERVSDKKVMGLWSPPNHATWLLGEIFAFQLGRLFERSDWTMPGVRMTLQGKALETARSLLSKKLPAARQCNQSHILSYIDSNPFYMVGLFKAFIENEKPIDVTELVDKKDGKQLDSTNNLVQLLNNTSRQPFHSEIYYQKNETLSVEKNESTLAVAYEDDLTKQLSFMMLVDALNAQRDRFGIYGSNMQAMYNFKDHTFRLSAIDNGGIASDHRTLSLNYLIGNSSSKTGVRRFEKDIFNKVIQLNLFLKKKKE